LRSLEGFHRVELAPHASAVVHFELSPRALSEVDDAGLRAVRRGSLPDLCRRSAARGFIFNWRNEGLHNNRHRSLAEVVRGQHRIFPRS